MKKFESILFCGDFYPSEDVISRVRNEENIDHTKGLINFITSHKYAFTNLEAPILLSAPKDKNTKGGPNLRCADGAAEIFSTLGFTHAFVSNNHICDFGKIGLEETVTSLSSKKIVPVGYLLDGKRVASRKIEISNKSLEIFNYC